MKAKIYKLLAKYQEELDNTYEVLKDYDTEDDNKLSIQGEVRQQERHMVELLQLVSP